VHPDKCKHPKAEDAFGAMAGAQNDLLDVNKRAFIARLYEDAQRRMLEERKLPPDSAAVQTPDFQQALRKAVNRMLAEVELERRRLQQREMEEQGRQAAELQRREEERKRKAEEVRADLTS